MQHRLNAMFQTKSYLDQKIGDVRSYLSKKKPQYSDSPFNEAPFNNSRCQTLKNKLYYRASTKLLATHINPILVNCINLTVL